MSNMESGEGKVPINTHNFADTPMKVPSRTGEAKIQKILDAMGDNFNEMGGKFAQDVLDDPVGGQDINDHLYDSLNPPLAQEVLADIKMFIARRGLITQSVNKILKNVLHLGVDQLNNLIEFLKDIYGEKCEGVDRKDEEFLEFRRILNKLIIQLQYIVFASEGKFHKEKPVEDAIRERRNRIRSLSVKTDFDQKVQ